MPLTKTPWEIKRNNQIGSVDLNGEGDYVAEYYDKRDAPLLATAPELLALLIERLEIPQDAAPWAAKRRIDWAARAKAAIAQATKQL